MLDCSVAFCKNYANNTVFYGAGNDLLLLSHWYPDELLKRKEDVYVAVTTSGFYEDIVSFLLGQGFKQEQIMNLSLATDVKNQYFDLEIIMPIHGEVFIDGGCFNCSTDKAFINWCSGDYKKIIAFEPDKKNYLHCLEVCQKEAIKNIEKHNKGLWDCASELSFEETGGQGSRIGGAAGSGEDNSEKPFSFGCQYLS